MGEDGKISFILPNINMIMNKQKKFLMRNKEDGIKFWTHTLSMKNWEGIPSLYPL